MSTFLLLHGAASSGWYWHIVEPLLISAGHETVAPDLPADNPNAGLDEYVATAIDAIDGLEAKDVIVVAQSMAGFFAPVVAQALAVSKIVLLAAMIPNPGERGHDWWVNTNQPAAQKQRFEEMELSLADLDNPQVIYGHDVPTDVWAEAGRRLRDQTGRPFGDPCPITAWPIVCTSVVVPREDRLFPVEFQRRIAKERLGIEVQTIPGGHLAALSQPQAVADALLQAAI